MKLSISSRFFLYISASIILAPFFILAVKSFQLTPSDLESWTFTQTTLAPTALASAKLLFATLFFSTLLGLFTSITNYLVDFPFRKYFQTLHLLPLAMPLYVLAFIYLGLLEYSGPVHSTLRDWGIDIYRMLPLKEWPGVSLVLSLGLYSYTFLISSNAIKNLERNLIKTSMSLGKNKLQTLKLVLLPLIKPSIVAGMIIVAMETLSDFGAVSAFNYDTFTTSIYTAWSSLFSFPIAARLSLFLLTATAILMYIEAQFKTTISNTKNSLGSEFVLFSPPTSIKFFILLLNILILFFALITPLITLVTWSIENSQLFDGKYFQLLLNSLSLALVVALLMIILGFFYAYSFRHMKSMRERLLVKLSLFGYAIPGNVIAVGVLIFFAIVFDLFSIKLSFYTALIAMIIGLGIRFLAVAFRNINSPLELISKNLDKSSFSLGKSQMETIKKIHLPLLKPALLTSGLLIFIEVIKELPLTLMLRPTGFDTLAIKTYELTSEGEWKRASVSAILLALLAILGSLIIQMKKNRQQHD